MEGQVVCVENIGPRESRRRLLLGVGLLVVALAGGVAMLLSGMPRLWRLLLVIPLGGATLSYYQARERTCVILARKGARNMDRGIEVVADPAVLAASRTLARRILVKAMVAAVLATLLLTIVPIR